MIGGGLVGGAIALGLARGGARVAILDEGDVAFRASRGNFALVWVQSKGLGMPEYALWSRRSADGWHELAGAAARGDRASTSRHSQPGGFMLCLSEAELRAARRRDAAAAQPASRWPISPTRCSTMPRPSGACPPSARRSSARSIARSTAM